MEVVPFPRTKDRPFVRRHAARWAASSPITAEKHLTHQLQLQLDTTARRGIAPYIIKANVAALEVAIGCELAKITYAKGGVA